MPMDFVNQNILLIGIVVVSGLSSEEIADVFRPEDEKPVPFVPVVATEPEPPLQARIEIICNGATIYDLEQLHSKLMDLSLRKQALVSGTLRIVI